MQTLGERQLVAWRCQLCDPEPALLRDADRNPLGCHQVAFPMSLLQSPALARPTQDAPLPSGETGPAPSCSLNAWGWVSI